MFTEGPRSIDLTAAIEYEFPEAWASENDPEMVSVLPMMEDVHGQFSAGWCSYASSIDSPDVEIITGGINSKNPDAAGIWRQGHLLHFGFQPSPAQMSANARALLINSIVYISRFHQDRALVRQPSPFVDGTSLSTLAADAAKVGIEVGVEVGESEFLAKAVEGLSGPAAKAMAAILRQRCPEGPESTTSAEWTAWLESNRPYLFWSRAGGERWYVDRLAKARGIPSVDLRGSDRADVTAEYSEVGDR